MHDRLETGTSAFPDRVSPHQTLDFFSNTKLFRNSSSRKDAYIGAKCSSVAGNRSDKTVAFINKML